MICDFVPIPLKAAKSLKTTCWKTDYISLIDFGTVTQDVCSLKMEVIHVNGNLLVGQ